MEIDRMNKKHALLMLACCLVPLIALGVINLFHIPLGQAATFGLILLCPLGHLLMMKTMAHGDHEDEHSAHPAHHAMHQTEKASDRS
jgi:predicted Na+-dependent transporter